MAGVEVDQTPIAELDSIVEDLKAEALSPSTRRAYGTDWTRYRAWAEQHGLDGNVIGPGNVGRFITSEVADGKSLATVRRRMASLSALAKRAGGLSLYDDTELKAMMAGLSKVANRTGNGKQRRATALTLERMAAVLPAIDTTTTAGARDRAILLLGCSALLRRSEIAGLVRSDIEASDRHGWLDVTIRSSKTSDVPETVAVGPLTNHPDLCPVVALNEWLAVIGEAAPSAPVFARVTRGDRISTDDDGQAVALDGDAINHIVKRRTAGIAGPADSYTGHSLRRGGATARAQRGATVMQLERAGRWSPGSAEVRKYVEAVSRADDQGATLLDLPLPGLETSEATA